MDVVAISFFAAYLAIMILIAFYAYRRSAKTSDDYFVASRSIGPVVLFFTLAATNFSAFTFFGFAGAAYKFGLAYYGIMGFGTGIMALSFFFLGRRIWRLGREKGYITPAELIGDRFSSDSLRMVFLGVMVVFTLPYIATQAIGGGIAFETLTDGEVSYELGAVLVTIVVVAYVTIGGMRADAYTDVLQGAMMFVTLIAAVGIVSAGLGGFTDANTRLAEEFPDLVSRPGGRDYFTPQVWLSFMLLWIFCDPMFPQLFVRFYSARDEKAIKVSMMMYAPITAVVFLCPVLIGAWGNLQFPGLTGSEPDQILPMMVDEFAPSWVLGIMLAGAFAALMSTADSQLLVLSSMLTRDVYKKWVRADASQRHEFIVGKALVVGLALLSLAIALSSVETLFETLTKTTFTGLAVLFPTTVAALYWRRANKWGCMASIAAGELLYAGFYFGAVPASYSWGFLPVVPVMIVATAALVGVSLATSKKG
ncbi:MAG: sodium:solute symporter family protein [Candidatus Thermoplasmatota archaeon]